MMEVNRSGLSISQHFELKSYLGQGAHSKVFLAMPGKFEIAVKVFAKKHNRQMLNEVEILSAVQHPNIIKLLSAGQASAFGCEVDFDHLFRGPFSYICLEYIYKGDLYELVKKSGRFSKSFSMLCFLHLLDGLNYLHSKGIVHRDLKLSNLLLRDTGELVMADFGLANSFNPNFRNSSCALGTKGYKSYEMLEKPRYDVVANDIFACGVILFNLLTGKMPFIEAKSEDPKYRNILGGDFQKFKLNFLDSFEGDQEEVED